MPQTVRKINLMYWLFGKCGGVHTCKECSNFEQGRYHDKTLRKCKVYGLTHSEASDWAQRYEACGMFNKEWRGNDIIALVRRGGCKKEIQQLDGQIVFDIERKGEDECTREVR